MLMLGEEFDQLGEGGWRPEVEKVWAANWNDAEA